MSILTEVWRSVRARKKNLSLLAAVLLALFIAALWLHGRGSTLVPIIYTLL